MLGQKDKKEETNLICDKRTDMNNDSTVIISAVFLTSTGKIFLVFCV